MLDLVRNLIARGQVGHAGQMCDDDRRRVAGEPEYRPGQELRDRGSDGPLDPGMHRIAARVQEQGDGLPEDQQRRRRHDEQQVLDHVVPEEDIVVAAYPTLQGEQHDHQPAKEHRCPPGGPRPNRMPPTYSDDPPEVQPSGDGNRHGDNRCGLPLGEHGLPAERRKHATSLLGEPTYSRREGRYDVRGGRNARLTVEARYGCRRRVRLVADGGGLENRYGA